MGSIHEKKKKKQRSIISCYCTFKGEKIFQIGKRGGNYGGFGMTFRSLVMLLSWL
jgi:hypothetical protein